jgi:hypothetical protein
VVPCGIAPTLPLTVSKPFVTGDVEDVQSVLLSFTTLVVISSNDKINGDFVIRILVVSTL